MPSLAGSLRVERRGFRGEPEKDWIVILKAGCTDAQMEELCQQYGKDHKCKTKGDPDHGGVPFMDVTGKEGALGGLWNNACVESHEPDGVVTIPELNMGEPSLAEMDEPEKDWIVILKAGCTDAQMDGLCQQYGKDHKCKAKGDPDHGGVPFMDVTGKESALSGLWNNACVESHELDGVVTIPELNMGEPSLSETDEPEKDWIVILKAGCTDAQMEELCQQYGKNHKCKIKGDPDHGGVPFMDVTGKEGALSGLWNNACVEGHELDGVMTIPELNMGEPSLVDEPGVFTLGPCTETSGC